MNIKPLTISIILFISLNAQSEEDRDPSFEAAAGYVYVENGSSSEIVEAIKDYSELTKEIRPGNFTIKLHKLASGGHILSFPDGFPTFDLANITGWLNAPPDQLSVWGAASWLRAPRSDLEFYLFPEESNKWGDTLVGSTSSGIFIRVYLPDTGISELTKPVEYKNTPSLSNAEEVASIVVTLDTDTLFGNPRFIPTKPQNYRWFQ